MNYDWSWGVFLEPSLDGSRDYLQMLFVGAGWTLMLATCAWTIALLLGSLIGTWRCVSSKPLKLVATIYVEVFRNIPLLVQLFLWYFVVPEFLPRSLGLAIKQLPHPWSAFWLAVLAMGCYGAARLAETLRSGIESLPRGQLQAARAMGLNEFQCYRHIILPEAFRIILPPMTSEMMGAIKYSSVALTVGLLELTGQARSMADFSFHIFEAFCAATIGYLVINGAVSQGMRLLERRVAVPGMIGAAPKGEV
ncbi:amino acid ABC transporter permease [Xylophilus sp. GW821-FHT01B05]